MRRGVNPLGVLDELAELGRTTVTTDPRLVPPLEEIDPERCYLIWQIDLETEAPPERLDDVFLFLADDSTVRIERLTETGSYELLPSPRGAISVADTVVSTRPAAAKPVSAPAGGAGRDVTPPPAPAGVGAPPQPPRPPSNGAAAPGPSPGFPPGRLAARIRVDANQLDDLVGLAGELAVLSDNLQALREVPGAHPWIHTLEPSSE